VRAGEIGSGESAGRVGAKKSAKTSVIAHSPKTQEIGRASRSDLRGATGDAKLADRPRLANTPEIGGTSRRDRRAAKWHPKSSQVAPRANTDEIGLIERSDRQCANRKPSQPAKTTEAEAPPSTRRSKLPTGATVANPIRAVRKASRRRNVHKAPETQHQHDIPAIIRELASQQRMRISLIVAQGSLNRRVEAIVASHQGYRLDAPGPARKAAFAAAKRYRVAVEGGGKDQVESGTQHVLVLPAVNAVILASAAARINFDHERERVEKRMRELAQQLPIWGAFCDPVRGFGALSLAILIGETGSICPNGIAEFRTVSGLWRYLGLAVLNGERQQRRTGDRALTEKFSPTKRAQAWVVSDTLLRAQWRGAKSDEDGNVLAEGRALGRYGEIYAKRRAHTAPRVDETAHLPNTDRAKWTPGRCFNDARRVMVKAMLRDLWVAWRRLERANDVSPLDLTVS